jgi:hypothetical protein
MNKTGFRVQGSGFRGDASPLHLFTSSPAHVPLRFGYTLLEVLLALGLTVIVLSLVGTAVHSMLRSVDNGRRRAEREQLARAIMHQIANDLRAVVRYEPFDDSGLNSGIGGGASGAASALSGATGGQSDPSGQSTGTSTSTTQTPSGQSTGETQTEETTEQTLTMPVAGIYGSANQVSIDITRIPRLDEYLYADGVNAPLFRGDVRTVSYYVGSNPTAMIPGVAPAATTTDPTTATSDANSGGLTRQESDRATALWQMPSAGAASSSQNASVLAPEVASLEFRYFDGTQWLTQWDSTAMKGVPRAVEIAIYLNDDANNSQPNTSATPPVDALTPTTNNPNNFYRMVVHLPAGLPLPAVKATTEEGTEEESTTSGTSTTSSTTPMGGGT